MTEAVLAVENVDRAIILLVEHALAAAAPVPGLATAA